MNIKVLKVKICSQCGDLLPQKCKNCIKHPARKPQIVEIHDLPQIIKKAECGCCVQFSCQRPGCKNTCWRYIPRARQAKRQFCSVQCCNIVIHEERKQRTLISCSNPKCDKKVERTPYMLKTFKLAYCCRSCKHIHQRIMIIEQKEKEEDLTIQNLECFGRCGRGIITEHMEMNHGSKNKFKCLKCNTVRTCEMEFISGVRKIIK